MSHLKQYINQMTNPELIGLAKNRFLDTEDQVAIAKHHYRRAHNYLIENRSLSRAARDVLWGYRGYAREVRLLLMVTALRNKTSITNCTITMATPCVLVHPGVCLEVFLAHYRWYSHGGACTEQTGTPASIIEDIYKRDVLPLRDKKAMNAQVTTTFSKIP